MRDLEQDYKDAAFEGALERLALGEASAVERGYLEAEARKRGESLDALLAGLEASDEEIRMKYPADMMAARIESQLDARLSGRRGGGATPARWFTGLGVLAAAGVAAFLIFSLPDTAAVPGGEEPGEVGRNVAQDTVRIKGAASRLIVWRKTSGAAERLEDGAFVRAGDVLQLEYSAAGAPYGVIGSLDGRGEFTLHHPADPGASTELKQGVTPLGFAYQLDDAPDYERFFFITSEEPLNIDEISRSIEALGASLQPKDRSPTLPADTHMTSIILEKN